MYVRELKSDRSTLQLSYHVGDWLIWLLLDCQVDDILYLLAELCKCKSTLGQQMCRASVKAIAKKGHNIEQGWYLMGSPCLSMYSCKAYTHDVKIWILFNEICLLSASYAYTRSLNSFIDMKGLKKKHLKSTL